MNKFLITLATLVAFALGGIANAQEAKIGGFIQHFVGMGDNVDGGVSHQFTRISASADTTLDNGWTAGGSFAIQNAATDGSFALPSSNSMYVATDFATVNIGATADAVTSLIPRIAAMVPGGGTDAGYQYNFDRGLVGSHSVQFSEAYYAWNAHRIDIDLPSVNGFTVGMTYTPSFEFTNASGTARAESDVDELDHGETTHIAISYSGEMDGMSYTIGVGSINGNSQSDRLTSDAVNNNDLSAVTGSIQITMGNLTIGAHGYDNGDSFGASSDAIKAEDSGYNLAATYAMGNMTVGIGYAHQELVRGTRRAASASAAATAGAVRQDKATMIGIGYNMGGGLNSFVQLSQNDHSDGLASNGEENDPQVIFAGISLGF